jgi:maltose/moltooligosaccharide transporter
MDGAAWCGICFATYQVVSFIYCFFLPSIARKTGGKAAYGLSLVAGGIGLICAFFIHDAYALILCMVGVGMAWGGIMTMPYSIIAHEISQKELGMYMGLFNITICIPQIICSLLLGVISKDVFHNNAMEIVCLGGVTMLIGALLMIRLQLKDNRKARKAQTA